MNSLEGLLLYSPVVYWLAFVLLLYRHDPSRLRHPFRDQGGARNWWLVLNKLDLLSSGQKNWMSGRKREFLPYVACIAGSLSLSLSWTLRLFPPVWDYMAIMQGIAAIVLTAATMRYLGNPPRRPYVDALRYPRLGSRISHLAKLTPVKQAKIGLPKEAVKKGTRMASARRWLLSPFRSIERRLRR